MRDRTALSSVVALLTLLLGSLFAVTIEADRLARTGSSSWLPAVGNSPAVTVMAYDNVVAVAGFLLSPVLVFAVGYVFGRRADLPREYGPVLAALSAGSVVGYGVGRTVAVLLTVGGDVSVWGVVGMVLPATVFVVARVALVGFAGAAVGYLRSERSRAAFGPPGEGSALR